MNDNSAMIGEVHCVGTEPELLECSHASIGSHRCGIQTDYDTDSDIIISCYGMYKCITFLRYVFIMTNR